MARKYEAPIRVLDVTQNPGRRSPYTVRWYVNGTSRWKSFKLKAPANDFYAKLIVAINARERFSDISGLPMSMETSGLTVASLCKAFVDKNMNFTNLDNVLQEKIELFFLHFENKLKKDIDFIL